MSPAAAIPFGTATRHGPRRFGCSETPQAAYLEDPFLVLALISRRMQASGG
jgi:hypothetical protein